MTVHSECVMYFILIGRSYFIHLLQILGGAVKIVWKSMVGSK